MKPIKWKHMGGNRIRALAMFGWIALEVQFHGSELRPFFWEAGSSDQQKRKRISGYEDTCAGAKAAAETALRDICRTIAGEAE